jgi:hypothetical protein
VSNAWRRFDAEDNEMRSPGNRWTRADLERLLDGQPVRRDALTEFLSAARIPGARADTAGLAEALAAYRSISSPVPAEKPRRTSMIKNIAAKMVAAKLLTIGGVALAATGGIAAAASTGNLPSPLPHSDHASQVAVAAVASSHGKPSASASPSSSASASATETDSESSEPTGAHPSATPSPSLRGLCQSWLSRPHEHGKADTNPAFTVLVTTAGGTDSVQAYCTALLASAPSESETSPSPSASASPDPSASDSHGKPNPVPSASHPSGKPSVLPTPSHPSGH